ncbi:MAG: metallophosphoesterase [Alphaproteobacteria bacterium]|nr:metallophosphoesterase [Alphaproteobacteria bacterium]
MFFVLSFIFSLAAIIITLQIMIGYNPEFSLRKKLAVSFVVVLAWFSPTIAGMIRWLKLLPEKAGIYVTQGLYTLFVTAFFLLGILLIRDLFWIHGYQIARKLGKASPEYDPMKSAAIKRANLMAVFAAVLLSGYSLYEGIKFPAVKETIIQTDKVAYPFKIVALTDTHITPVTSVSFVEKLVRTVNGLKPDITVLVGDIVDAKPASLGPQMQALSGLDAKYGVFVTLGNHEFYHGSLEWEMKFKQMGLFYLANEGLTLNGANVYLSGLPDPQLLMITDQTMEGIKETLNGAAAGAYRVFLSHSPRFIKRLNKDLIDFQISGHTHGGQIFPFHFLVKRFNDFLAGLYDVDGMKLYVSRGAGGWGPPMRLFAPSEISVITLMPPEKKLMRLIEI